MDIKGSIIMLLIGFVLIGVVISVVNPLSEPVTNEELRTIQDNTSYNLQYDNIVASSVNVGNSTDTLTENTDYHINYTLGTFWCSTGVCGNASDAGTVGINYSYYDATWVNDSASRGLAPVLNIAFFVLLFVLTLAIVKMK